MITYPLIKFNSPIINQAFIKLNNTSGLDAVTAARVNRICQAVDKAMQKAKDHGQGIIGQYCFKDDKGELKYTALDPGTPQMRLVPEFLSPLHEQEYDAACNKYLTDTIVEIKAHKLEFEAIRHVKGLTGHEMAALEDFVEGLPEVL